METVTLTIKVSDIQLLNSIISTSVPNAPFSTVTQFVTEISQQLQSQLKAAQAEIDKRDGAVEVEPEDNGGLKKA